MAKKLNPEVQARKIKRTQEKEKKSYEKQLATLEKAKSKRSPKEQAYEDYKQAMNMMTKDPQSKKNAEIARKKFESFG